jgi:hypothetical protein
MEVIRMKHALKLLALIPGLALVPATAALAQDDAKAAKVVTQCIGGAQEFVNGFTNNVAVGVPVGGTVPASIVPGGPSVPDSDLYVVTFSAQTSVPGGGTVTVQAQANIGPFGSFVPIDPVGPNSFHQGAAAETHTMTWCRRIQAANPVFRIVTGGAPAVFDDYTTLVHRSN